MIDIGGQTGVAPSSSGPAKKNLGAVCAPRSGDVGMHVHQTGQEPRPCRVNPFRSFRDVLPTIDPDDPIAVHQNSGVWMLAAGAHIHESSTGESQQVAHDASSGSTSSTNRRYWSAWFQLVIRNVTSVKPRSRICRKRSAHCCGDPVATH